MPTLIVPTPASAISLSPLVRFDLGQHVPDLVYYFPTKGKVMPTVLNVHEAKARFSGVLSEVENDLTVITIMRYGRPVAKIVPIAPKRNLSPLPGFAGNG